MDILKLIKSKTREKLLKIFLDNPGKDFYLRELERKTSFSVGNIRRELNKLVLLGLFEKYKKENFVFFRLNLDSPWLKPIARFYPQEDLISNAFNWVFAVTLPTLSEDRYCSTRDVFQARLESLITNLEKDLGMDAFLLGAIAGEIGNNSYDHNLGRWPNLPGIFLAFDKKRKTIVLADRGVGILATISHVRPEVKNDREALNLAFTQIISGRKGEHRGNGLKFVSSVVKEKKWQLEFFSGQAEAILKTDLLIKTAKQNLKGCLAVIKY